MLEKIELMKVMAQVYCAALKDSKAQHQFSRRLEAKETVEHFIELIDKMIE